MCYYKAGLVLTGQRWFTATRKRQSEVSASIFAIGFSLGTGLAIGIWLGWRWQQRRLGGFAQENAAELRKQLQRAQRMEALGILSGSIMHNLNNLLSVATGQARLAREVVAPDTPAWHSLGQVVQASEAAAELSREIDSYQREVDRERQPLRLQSTVRSTVKLLRDILPASVRIETDLDPACGPVLASPTQVQQVLMSLCSNAHHAMFRRHGRIAISLTNCEITAAKHAIPRDLAPGSYVKLSVADNGRGMDAETLKRIFEPYFSARAPRRGAGLGLTMVSRLLAANEGVTIPSSLPGHGSRFDIYFPLIARGQPNQAPVFALAAPPAAVGAAAARTPSESYAAPAATICSPDRIQSSSRSAHILLLEDDSMVADTVRACLERMGMRVTSFADGARAVAAFVAEPGAFDLLLTDQFLYGLDGREVIAEIRRYRPRMPVILMSGHPEGILAEDIEQLGINGALIKPFTLSQLNTTIKAALRLEPLVNEGRA